MALHGPIRWFGVVEELEAVEARRECEEIEETLLRVAELTLESNGVSSVVVAMSGVRLSISSGTEAVVGRTGAACMVKGRRLGERRGVTVSRWRREARNSA